MTGVCPPVSGSTRAENPKPVEAAIFSPAIEAALNHIVNVSPDATPTSISVKIIIIKLSMKEVVISNSLTYPKLKKHNTIEKTILAVNGTFLEPRNGLDNKNEDSLIELKKNKNKY